jgi:hypothetical protein
MSLGTRILSVPLTIAAGTQTSNSSRTGFKSTPVAVIFPAAMTGTGITFEMTDDGTNWYPVVGRDGNVVTITKVNSSFPALNKEDFMGIQEIQVKSSGNEGADRIIKIICRDVT